MTAKNPSATKPIASKLRSLFAFAAPVNGIGEDEYTGPVPVPDGSATPSAEDVDTAVYPDGATGCTVTYEVMTYVEDEVDTTLSPATVLIEPGTVIVRELVE
jgi:hypothetical protein